ncbi:MAG TPA: DUF3105 domain-containing protein [Actinomycetota bacterium]|nr:DUF3105 domain-containing protein [Actinomycetota bacterium]
MANKKRRKQNRHRNAQARSASTTTAERPSSGTKTGDAAPAQSSRPPTPATRSPAPSTRAEKKELARQERERVRKQVARRSAIRRALTIGGILAVVAVGAYLIFRVSSPGIVAAEALEVGQAAGCSDIQTPVGSAPGGSHLASGESAGYSEDPATSGPHDPSPLPSDPAVYTEPVREENAVHNLEHAYVILYYRAEGPEALDQEVVDRLGQIAEGQEKVLLAPYPDLEEGTSLAMTAWNKLWECPGGVSAGDAATMADAFIEAYRGTSNAPEANAP